MSSMSPLLPALVTHNATLVKVVLGHSCFTAPAALNPNEAHAKSGIKNDGADDDERAADQGLIALLLHYPSAKTLHISPWWTRSQRAVLFAQLPRTAFWSLTALSLSSPMERRYVFTESLVFEIVSLTPALKRLDIGRIDDDVRDESLYKPACSLESLRTASFGHYEMLLSRSHDTLVDFRVSFGSDRDLHRALSHCPRVRHLTLTNNYFDVADVMAAFPRVRSLSLSDAPSEAEMAVLQGPLRVLEISHNSTVFPGSAALYVDKQWPRLREIIYSSQTLRTVRLRFYRRSIHEPTEAWQEMLRVCKERRIVFETEVFFGDS